jgi:hypothetical protein
MLEPLGATIRQPWAWILAQAGQPVPIFPGQGPEGGPSSTTECHPVPGNAISCVTSAAHNTGVPPLLWVFLIFWVAGILLALYAASDMNRRGQSGCLWGALVMFGGWIGIFFWLNQRRQYPVLSDL